MLDPISSPSSSPYSCDMLFYLLFSLLSGPSLLLDVRLLSCRIVGLSQALLPPLPLPRVPPLLHPRTSGVQ